MKKKTHTIQVRVNDQEYQTLLLNCSQSKMQRSDYIRACLAGSQVTEMKHKREIAVLPFNRQRLFKKSGAANRA